MDKLLYKLIEKIFYFLFLLTPLLLFPKTSEIFEFNKIVFVYLITAILTGLWICRMFIQKKWILPKTPLNIPIFLFLLSQLAATIFSMDHRTSIYGYYSRFNGGLLSSICYSILYFIYLSVMDREKTLKAIKILFISTLISSVWAIFEHFGYSFSCLIFPGFGVFDVSCWVQDVKTRVFSTFGQPNWLAAWLSAIIPLTWALGMMKLESQVSKKTISINLLPFLFHLLGAVFLVALLFTKSRSGILAFGISYLMFWPLNLFLNFKHIRTNIRHFVVTGILVAGIIFVFGSPWTPSWLNSLNKLASPPEVSIMQAPALEGGGTESGKIRQIVWRGALEVWKKYPIFGSGVETFAFSYYAGRPSEHNLTSEWDYLYNKAHNEYLNYAATTGILGFLAYMFLIGSVITMLARYYLISRQENERLLTLSILSGYITILVTNFFGFSTVPLSLLFFIYPAIALAIKIESKTESQNLSPLNLSQKIMVTVITLATALIVIQTVRYWSADLSYANGKLQKESGDYESSLSTLTELIKRSPREAVYWDELSEVLALTATQKSENGDTDLTAEFAKAAYSNTNISMSLSPHNVTLKRKAASRFITLSGIEPSYLIAARNILENAVVLAPTDAKLHYNLSLAYLRTGDYKNAIKVAKTAVELKPDYERARYALALMYDDEGEKEKAIEQVNYILKYLNPNSEEAKRELQELEK